MFKVNIAIASTTIILLMLPIYSRAQSESFFEKVLGSKGRNSYYVSLIVRSPSYEGIAVVENDHLFRYLTRKKKINEGSYREFVQTLLESARPLDLKGFKYDKASNTLNNDAGGIVTFHIVPDNAELKIDASLDCAELVKKYFDRSDKPIYRLLPKTPLSTQNVIIHYLFKRHVAANVNQYSGSLVIESKNLPCPG